MIAELVDDPEAWYWVAMAVGFATWLVLRWRHKHRVVETRAVRSLGAFAGGELGLYLAAAPGGRRYVSLEYEVESEDETKEIEVLFSAKQAAALAAHLEVAAFPHASLAHARAAARRARAARRKSPEATQPEG